MAEHVDKKDSKITHHVVGVGLGSGAGGGFGLNAVGPPPNVTHFAAKGGKKDGPNITPDCESSWNSLIGPTDVDIFGWVLCEYDSSGKTVELKQKGSGGLQEFKSALKDANGVAWGGFRCNGVDSRGSVVCKRPKFVFVQYIPSTAPAMRRAKMGSHKGALKAAFDKAHMDVVVEDIEEDLNCDRLAERLQSATGAHKPNGYEFDKDVITNADYYKDL